MAELGVVATGAAAAAKLPSLTIQGRNTDCCGATCVCCSKGAVVYVNKSFVYEERGCLEGLCDCLGWNTAKNQATREKVQEVVESRFTLYGAADSKRKAIELLEGVDPNWEVNKALGKSLPERVHATIIQRLKEATTKEASEATRTIRAKPPARPGLIRQFSVLFTASEPLSSSGPSDVAKLLPELITLINSLQRSGINGIDQVTRIQQWLTKKGYPFGYDAVADLIEVLEGQPTSGPGFNQLVPDVENRFTVAAMASTR